MKQKISLLLTLLLQMSVCATELTANGLKNLLESKNSRVAAAKLQVEAAGMRKGSLTRSFFPAIEIYGAQESFKTGNQDQKQQPAYGAEAKINLFNGGRDKLESEIRSLESEKKNYQFLRVQSEELEKARTLYWKILYLKEKTELLNSVIKINTQNLRSAERRIQNGVATESDRVEFEMKSVELNQELEETTLRLNIQIRDLAILLNFDDPNELQFFEKMDHEHEYASALTHSFKDHEFLFKENELASGISSLESKSQQRTWWPTLDAFASYNQYNQREKDSSNISDRSESILGVRLSMSLSSALESGHQSESLHIESLSSKKLAELQKKEIDIHIKNETDELNLLHNQVHAAEENIIRAEKYYKLTQSEYARGVKNSPDVLGASEKLFEVKNKRIEIIRDFQIAKAHVLSKIGK